MTWMPQVQTAYFPLKGGEDMVTAPLSVDPGALLLSLNYEPAISHGYRRIDGFERVDGQPKASNASYWLLPFRDGAIEPAAGDLVASGLKSGLVLDVVLDSGSYAGGDATGTLVLFDVSGVFANNDALTLNAAPFGNAAGPSDGRAADTAEQDRTWLIAAMTATRNRIQPVPGSGPLRGAAMLGGVMYAWRDNVGATQGGMYRSTATGWEAVDLGIQITFTAGLEPMPLEGETVTGGTSLATGKVAGITVTSGSWSGPGTAAGYLYLYDVTGTFQNTETLTASGGGTVTSSSAPVGNVLAAGGQYEVVNESFKATASGARLFCVNGVNRAFQFDGEGFAFINTGMGAADKPFRVIAHKAHLFLMYPGGSVQHSGIGDPMNWDAATGGAGEIGLSDEGVGFAPVPGDVLAMFSKNRTHLLQGTSAADWNLVLHSDEVGAYAGTIQNIGMPRYMTDRGLVGLDTTQAYGDFTMTTFSQRVQPFLMDRKTDITASIRVRQKDQYRLFFSDGTGLICKFRHDAVEFTRANYGMPVRVATSVNDQQGNEVLLFGSDDGYLYQMDSGMSFDGAAILGLLRLPFGHLKSPQHVKRFRKVVLEMDSAPGTEITFSQEYDYATLDIPRGREQSLTVGGDGGLWGVDTWGKFVWGNQVVGSAEGYLAGSGTNIGIYIRTESAYTMPHTLHGMILHYSIRSRKR